MQYSRKWITWVRLSGARSAWIAGGESMIRSSSLQNAAENGGSTKSNIYRRREDGEDGGSERHIGTTAARGRTLTIKYRVSD